MSFLIMKDLEDAYLKNLKSIHTRTRHRSCMKCFLMATQKDWQTPLSDVFNDRFATDADAFAASKKTKRFRRGTRTMLRLWEAEALELIAKYELPPDFGDALKQLMRHARMSVSELARRVCRETGDKFWGVSDRIHDWRNNHRFPTTRKIPLVEHIEDVLQVSRGTLASRVLIGAGTDTLFKRKSRYSPYAKKMASIAVKSYAVDIEKVPHLKAEWDGFYRFKTARILQEGERRQRFSRWTVRPGQGCVTGTIRRKHTGLFLGFLHMGPSDDKRESGLSIPMPQLSIALLSVTSFVIRYIQDFVVERADGVYNQAVLTFFLYCREVTREETGYLRQHPEVFARRVMFTEEWKTWIKSFPGGHKRLLVESWWDEWCEHSYLRYHEIVLDLLRSKTIGRSRDPEYNIRAIIKLDHPMEALFTLLERIEKYHRGDEKSASPRQRAVKYRNLLLIKLLSVNPLRVRNLAELTWRRDNTGHLQQANGEWQIRIRKDEFKNWYSSRPDKDYVAPLPPDCNRYIDQYLALRGHLRDADACDYLFLMGSPKESKSGVPRGFGPKEVSMLVVKLTRAFMPEELAPGGFGPHAFRHIVAHSYLKSNPKAYVVVADILNDKIETVMKEYGHLDVADNLKHWLSFYEGERGRLKDSWAM